MNSISSQPLVSVIMCVFNEERFVSGAVESILDQTYSNWELILVDDCSTDTTSTVLQKYNDVRIQRVRNPHNMGLTFSLNRAIAECHGKYIANLDADDCALPERLGQQVEVLETNPGIGAVGTAAEIIDSENRVVNTQYPPTHHRKIYARLSLNNCLYHSSLMARHDVLLELGGYNPEFEFAQDYDLWRRIGEISEISCLPAVLVQRRSMHENSIGYKHFAEQQAFACRSSMNIVSRLMQNRTLDRIAYERLWWSIHGQLESWQQGDGKRLESLFMTLSAHSDYRLVWAHCIRNLAHKMQQKHPLIALEIWRICTKYFGLTQSELIRAYLGGLLRRTARIVVPLTWQTWLRSHRAKSIEGLAS